MVGDRMGSPRADNLFYFFYFKTTNLNYFVYSPNSDILTNQFMISPKGSNIMKIIQQQLLKDILLLLQ